MLNGHKGDQGLELIERFRNGETLDNDELQSMRSTMYLVWLYLNPQRTWEDFQWPGPEAFAHEIWPEIMEREELLSGLFGHGAVSP